LQRWQRKVIDGRCGPRTAPANKLSEEVRNLIIKTSVKSEFASLSPHQIVPKLADRGIYLGSEATFYRVLNAESLSAHRGRAKPRSVERPKSYEAEPDLQLGYNLYSELRSRRILLFICISGSLFQEDRRLEHTPPTRIRTVRDLA
jgi:hypothetical protein